MSKHESKRVQLCKLLNRRMEQLINRQQYALQFGQWYLISMMSPESRSMYDFYIEQKRDDAVRQLREANCGFRPSPELLKSLNLGALETIPECLKVALDANLHAQVQIMNMGVQKVVSSAEYNAIESQIQGHLTALCNEHNALVEQEVIQAIGKEEFDRLVKEEQGPSKKRKTAE